MKISERLSQIKGSRAVSAWERETGIARGNLDRALKDDKLSEENIRKLCRAENLRSDWLLFGDGSPYRVAVFHSDEELAEQLGYFFSDEAAVWTVTVVRTQSNDVPCAVVLTMPAESQSTRDNMAVKSIVVEVLAGPVGLETSKLVCRPEWGRVQGLALADDIARQLCSGQLGTFALLFDPGYLLNAQQLDPRVLSVLRESNGVGERKNGYESGFTAEERQLVKRYRALQDGDKARLIAIADAFIKLSEL